MPVGVHAFRGGQALRRKAYPPKGVPLSFEAAYDGICCDNCGGWGIAGTAFRHAHCSSICGNCGLDEEHHAAGWCLFRPTKWERFSFEWEGYR